MCADALPNKPCQVGILLFNNKKKKKQRKLQQLLEKWSLKNESKGNLSKQKLKNEPFQTRQPGKKRENRSPFQNATTGKNTYSRNGTFYSSERKKVLNSDGIG